MSGPRRLLVRAAAALALAAALAGCTMGSAKPAAEEQVMPFHDRYNARQFQAMYDSADPKLRASISRDDFVRFGDGLHRKLGRVTATVPAGWNVMAGTSGTDVTLTYQTTFEKAEATETFQFRVHGGKATLVGYNVNSPALVME
jgi:hypothetical protein